MELKKKFFLWTIILITVFLISTIALFVAQKMTYQVHGPVSVAESKLFNVDYIKLDHQTIESSDINDYLVTTVRIENISDKRLSDFQFTLRFDDKMQKYAPVIISESSKKTLSRKSSDEDFRGNFATFTSDLLIVKPSLLSDDDRTEMLDLVNNMTLELSWQSGKEILLPSESDITYNLDFQSLKTQTNP